MVAAHALKPKFYRTVAKQLVFGALELQVFNFKPITYREVPLSSALLTVSELRASFCYHPQVQLFSAQ